MKPRKPLFSRKQLNWLIIILVSLIALLSLAPQDGGWPALQRSELAGVSVVAPQAASPHPPLVRLILRLPPYLDGDAPLAAELERLLGEQLQLAPVTGLIQRHRLPDRLRLTLKLDTPAALDALLTQLARRPSPAQFARAELRLEAARRLAAHAPLPPVWAADASARDAPLAQRYDQWLSRANLRLVFTQPLDAALGARLDTALARLPAGAPWADAPPPLPPSMERQLPLDHHQLLLVRELPGRQDPAYERQLLAVHWLQQRAAPLGLRVDWQPRAGRSRLALHASGPQPLDNDALLKQLAPPPADSADPAAQRVLTSARQRLRASLLQPLHYLNLLETIASYDLAPDALAHFDALLDTLDEASLRQQLSSLLDSAAFHRYAAHPLNQEAVDHAP